MDVNDDILGPVLERVDSHVSLILAAAVCRRWRRAIADAAFLRRFRSLRAPPVAGYYHDDGGRRRSRVGPVFYPSSPSVPDARHFSLDFLPGGASSWIVRDSRGSLLVLCHASRPAGFPYKFPEIVVCEPLTQRYKRIPPPTDFNDDSCCWKSFLIDGEVDEVGGHISMSNFRVLCIFETHADADMYTVGSSWSKKNIRHIVPSFVNWCFMGYGGGCWYFVKGTTLIALDGNTGDFSSSEFPPLLDDWDPHAWDIDLSVTDGRDGKLRILAVFNGTMKMFVRLEGGEWALEKVVLLSEATCGLPGYKPSFFSESQYVLRVGEGYAILSQYIKEPLIFSINLETMEAAPATESMTQMVYVCKLPWPPTLHACLDR
ncbi:unnamed protein product [Urochloa decumbens]|uniref:F-box domain-containing protein n=1 Tax=Urochloa decumbens TaxID=240449 RepID=A0ABC9H452_9POAL